MFSIFSPFFFYPSYLPHIFLKNIFIFVYKLVIKRHISLFLYILNYIQSRVFLYLCVCVCCEYFLFKIFFFIVLCSFFSSLTVRAAATFFPSCGNRCFHLDFVRWLTRGVLWSPQPLLVCTRWWRLWPNLRSLHEFEPLICRHLSDGQDIFYVCFLCVTFSDVLHWSQTQPPPTIHSVLQMHRAVWPLVGQPAQNLVAAYASMYLYTRRRGGWGERMDDFLLQCVWRVVFVIF